MAVSRDDTNSALNNLTQAHEKMAEWCRVVMEKPNPDIAEIKEVMKFLKDNYIDVGVVKPGSPLDRATKAAEEKLRKARDTGDVDLIKLFPDAKPFRQETAN